MVLCAWCCIKHIELQTSSMLPWASCEVSCLADTILWCTWWTAYKCPASMQLSVYGKGSTMLTYFWALCLEVSFLQRFLLLVIYTPECCCCRCYRRRRYCWRPLEGPALEVVWQDVPWLGVHIDYNWCPVCTILCPGCVHTIPEWSERCASTVRLITRTSLWLKTSVTTLFEKWCQQLCHKFKSVMSCQMIKHEVFWSKFWGNSCVVCPYYGGWRLGLCNASMHMVVTNTWSQYVPSQFVEQNDFCITCVHVVTSEHNLGAGFIWRRTIVESQKINVGLICIMLLCLCIVY